MTGQAAERARIVNAAYGCLADAGGDPVSITDILTAAGLSTRAFYRHFESKDALLLAMFRRDAVQVMAELQTITTAAPSPAEALRGLVDGMLRLPAEGPRRRRVLALTSGDATRARGYGEEQARFRAEQEAAIVRILAEGRAQGTFPWADPEPDARSIRAAIGQAFDDQMTGTARVTAAEAAAQVTGFALRALGAGPDTAPTDESAVSSP